MTSGCFEPATIITSTALKSMINGMGRREKPQKPRIKLQINAKPQIPFRRRKDVSDFDIGVVPVVGLEPTRLFTAPGF
jgi:hypothetical protein